MKGQLSVQTVVKAAKDQLSQAFADEKPHSLRLEEIQLDGTTWKITISFTRAGTTMTDLLGVRTFKVVRINDHTGDLVAITHREINADSSR